MRKVEKENSTLTDRINKFHELESWMPGIKIIQRIEPAENLFICGRGMEHFKLSHGFFRCLSNVEFKKLIFDEECPQTCLIGTFEEKEQRQSLYIRFRHSQSLYESELISVNLLEDDLPGLLNLRLIQIFPTNLVNWVSAKSSRIVNEMTFFKNHQKKYQNLSNRNKEVLSFMVKGMSAEEIGEKLFIGINTVNTHKRRIREFLELKSNYELLQYGMAFDLI